LLYQTHPQDVTLSALQTIEGFKPTATAKGKALTAVFKCHPDRS